jgi:hypothetical protein
MNITQDRPGKRTHDNRTKKEKASSQKSIQEQKLMRPGNSLYEGYFVHFVAS